MFNQNRNLKILVSFLSLESNIECVCLKPTLNRYRLLPTILYVNIYLFIYLSIYPYIYIDMYICIFIYTYMYMCIYTLHTHYICKYTYIYIYIYISGHKWSTTHRVLKSHNSKMGVMYMHSRKQCVLLVITTMALCNSCTWAHDVYIYSNNLLYKMTQ